MAKIKTLLAASAFAAASMVGMAGGALAQAECAYCSKASATHVSTVKGKSTRAVSRATRTVVKNVNKTRYVRKVKRVVNTHYRQQIVHVRRVTRVHHRTVNLHSTQVVSRVVTLPSKTVYSSSTVHVRHPAKNVRCGVCR